MEATLDALSTCGLGSGMRVTLPGNVALQSAVSSVWGHRVSVQRCLNTVMEEALTGLDPDEAMQFRHRLQPAWQQWDASSAQTSLQQITDDLTKVNRGQVLDHAPTDGASASRPARVQLAPNAADARHTGPDRCASSSTYHALVRRPA